MTSTDRLIALAEDIAKQMKKVKRNDWIRWVQVVEAYQGNVVRAIHFAQRASRDTTLRPNIQSAYDSIARAIGKYQKQLAVLTPQEQQQVFGYVAWTLKVRHG